MVLVSAPKPYTCHCGQQCAQYKPPQGVFAVTLFTRCQRAGYGPGVCLDSVGGIFKPHTSVLAQYLDGLYMPACLQGLQHSRWERRRVWNMRHGRVGLHGGQGGVFQRLNGVFGFFEAHARCAAQQAYGL